MHDDRPAKRRWCSEDGFGGSEDLVWKSVIGVTSVNHNLSELLARAVVPA
jgi:hypothetical protein